MNRKYVRAVIFMMAIMASPYNQIFARENISNVANHSSGNGASVNPGNKTPTSCPIGTSKVELDINNVRTTLMNGGDMWWDRNNARYEIPKVDDPSKIKKHSLFAGSIWIGGIDSDQNVLVTAETYASGGSQSYFPGPIVDEVALDINSTECEEWNRHFKVELETIEHFQQDFVNGKIKTEEDIPKEILQWAGKNNPYLNSDITTMDKNLAPFVDIDSNDVYNPMDGDYPDILGDQAIWWIMNDVGGEKNLGDAVVVDAIGLEISSLAFAFATNDQINNMTFYKNVIKNKGSKTLEKTYIGQWVDADLGNYDDDYVGCDVSRGLGICYNGKTVDAGFRGYGVNPPAVGVDFFKGPVADPNDGIDNDHDCIVDEDGETIVMSNFLYYNNDNDLTNGNPFSLNHFYNYLRNIWKDGKSVTYGENGIDQNVNQLANYMFPGETDLEYGWGIGGSCANPVNDPSINKPWTEVTAKNDPADRRFLQSAGPFTLLPGAVNEITTGVVWCRSGSGGPTGSLACLKIADDVAQTLFDRDFKILNGPDAPDVHVVELDQELVLSLMPREIYMDGNKLNTETYMELDKRLESSGATDPFFRFQGYKVYQLAGPDVSATDIENPDLARLISQCDLSDGVTKLINTTFDPNLEAFVPELANESDDKGIFHTLHLSQDAFTSGNLVNFKKYYYMVMAYAYNVDSKNDIINSDGQQYLVGRKNVRVYEGMPHITENRKNGTVLNSDYGTGINITRIRGIGNGGHELRLTNASEGAILQNFEQEEVTYAGGYAPIYVKVYDPINVKQGDFNIKMFSRLVYPLDDISAKFTVGDTIVALDSSIHLPILSDGIPPDSSFISEAGDLPQIGGVAIIREIMEDKEITYEQLTFSGADQVVTSESGMFRVVKLEMLNEDQWGTFKFDYKLMGESNTIDDGGKRTSIFLRYEELGYSFVKKNDFSLHSEAFEFNLNDYWELENLNSHEIIMGDKRISEFSEQLIPEYGIAVELKGVKDPLYNVLDNLENGFVSAEIQYGEDGKGEEWIGEVELEDSESDDYDPWMDLVKELPDHHSKDPVGMYRRVLGGSWAPYSLVRPLTVHTSGASYVQGRERSKIYELGNIDIVITKDKTLWSKCVVLQFDKAGTSPSTAMLKSEVTSKTIDGNEDSGIGQGWFPGYAIDLDRGIRLNLMFSESKSEDPERGNDLMWDPTKEVNGSRSYIYVTSSKYDEGDRYSSVFDQIKNSTIPGSVSARNGYVDSVFSEITWVGNIKVAPRSGFMASDITRVKLRVNKQYRGRYEGESPEYQFNTSDVVAKTNNLTVADSALGLIRMVPNPYYGYSEYESNQLDNVVKITNLPYECTIRIFNVSGTLIRTYRKSSDAVYIDWNLRNQKGLPIAGGVYFAHIEAPGIGETVVKWFGVVRSPDYDTL